MSAAPNWNGRIRALAWVGAVGLVGAQFVPAGRTNPPVGARLVAPAEVEVVLRRSCFDCHSHETRWPWYSYVAPVSWWLVRHVDRGRGDLNFSQWPTLDAEARTWILRDIERQLMERKMPLRSYTRLHLSASLNDADRDVLLRWVREQR